MFASVTTGRHAETKAEVETLEALVPEEVSLYHPEVLHFLITHREFYTVSMERGREGRRKGGGKVIKADSLYVCP